MSESERSAGHQGREGGDPEAAGHDPTVPGEAEPTEAEGAADPPDRRRFIQVVVAVSGAVVTTLAALPFLGMLFAPAKRESGRVWRDLGPVDAFAVGTTTRVTYPDPDPDPWSGMAVRNAAWLRRVSAERFTAFSIYCTHTGCPVRWLNEADLFVCPCHGGVFDREGDVSAGPPPRPLDRPPVRIRGGRVEILATGVPTPD